MLIHLQISNFAIIDRLELDFSTGMTAITGETGAGKSIAVDALGLLLGDRADSSFVRHNAEQADIIALIDIARLRHVQNWLVQRELDADGECQLRRIIARNGRSRSYINGHLQPLTVVRELGQYLIDIHSQHEHQSLLRRDSQLQLLDDFGNHSELCSQLRQYYQDWQTLLHQLNNLAAGEAEREARKDLLRYQLNELQELALRSDEIEELAEEQRLLANAERLMAVSQQALEQLYDAEQDSLQSRLSRLLNTLDDANELDSRLRPSSELLNHALVHIEEASHELRAYSQSIEQDPQRLNDLEDRLGTIHRLARKHRCEADQLVQKQHTFETELAQLSDENWDREALTAKTEAAQAQYQSMAKKLSRKRERCAKALSETVSTSMQGLGMRGGQFSIALKPRAQASAQGLEYVEFMVSANPGQPLQALTKVASGGELSRISLAIQVTAADTMGVPTLIFDEVDSGIGGSVADIVGQLLRQLGQQRQVLCVTHLPQVAAQSHQHLRVSKHVSRSNSKQQNNAETRTQVAQLDASQRVEELARMLGGRKLTQKTLEHAREMIQQGAQT